MPKVRASQQCLIIGTRGTIPDAFGSVRAAALKSSLLPFLAGVQLSPAAFHGKGLETLLQVTMEKFLNILIIADCRLSGSAREVADGLVLADTAVRAAESACPVAVSIEAAAVSNTLREYLRELDLRLMVAYQGLAADIALGQRRRVFRQEPEKLVRTWLREHALPEWDQEKPSKTSLAYLPVSLLPKVASLRPGLGCLTTVRESGTFCEDVLAALRKGAHYVVLDLQAGEANKDRFRDLRAELEQFFSGAPANLPFIAALGQPDEEASSGGS